MTSLDGINGRSIQTLLRGENDSKQSDEFQATFIAQISSSENVLKRDAILAPVAKQWMAKDIPSYGSQSKRAKIAIHWFGIGELIKYSKASLF